MNRSCLFGSLACAAAFAGVTQASSAPLCQPSLAFKEVQFSPMQPPTMQRT
jgi:hypothetical protein